LLLAEGSRTTEQKKHGRSARIRRALDLTHRIPKDRVEDRIDAATRIAQDRAFRPDRDALQTGACERRERHRRVAVIFQP
jgi:hypothetical protein